MLTHRRRARGRHWYAAATIGVGALVATTVTVPAGSATTTQTATAHTASAGPTLTPAALAGQTSHTVTLITGDRVTLTTQASGQTTVTQVPGSGPSTLIQSRFISGPQGTQHVYALPSAAFDLIGAKALDQSLFDVQYLAAHGDDGANAHIPVTLRFAGTTDVKTLTTRASALPGAAVGTVHATTGTVDVSVDAAHAAAFWQALTGRDARASAQIRSAYTVGHPAPGLVKAASAWTTGAQTAPVKPADDLPTYSVTMTVKLAHSTIGSCLNLGGGQDTMCPIVQTLEGVQNGAFVSYDPVSATCVDESPCDTIQFAYQVPPGTYEADATTVAFDPDGYTKLIDLTRPEIQVTSDTAVTVDADTARSLVPSTPTPTVPRTASVTQERQFDGDFRVGTGWSGAYGDERNLVVPADAPTTGTYTLSDDYVMGAAPVSMSSTGKTPITLHPTYPFRGSHPWAPDGSVRFPLGTHTYPVVAAGHGSTQDFAGVDARGKLALVQATGCSMPSSVLDAAAAAGVIGVILDPSYAPDTSCELPIIPDWWNEPVPADFATAYVTIPAGEAASLRDQVAAGPVSVKVTDVGDDTPVYNLSFAHEGRIPADLHDSVTARQLTTSRTTFADDKGVSTPYAYLNILVAFRPNTNFMVGGYDETKPAMVRDEYFGPVSPDVGWNRSLEVNSAVSDGPAPTGPAFMQAAQAYTVRGGTTTADWYAAPAAPGAVAEDQALAQAQPHEVYAQFCAMCRAGDFLLPVIYLTSDADREQFAGAYLFGPDQMHLYQGTTELPQSKQWGVAGYQLSPQKQRYRLDTTTGSIATEWIFDSAAPTTDRTTAAAPCITTVLKLSTDPCAADPLLFLRYDAGLGATNTAAAGSRHQLVVNAYHQDPTAPPAKSLTLAISTDGGTTWQNLPVHSKGGGDFTADYTLPPSAAGGTVSIKAHAVDAAGDEVTQTMTDAFSVVSGR